LAFKIVVWRRRCIRWFGGADLVARGGASGGLEEQIWYIAGPAINPVQGFWTQLLQYCIAIGSETTFLSALCVIRCPNNLVWSRTFLLGVGLTDLGHFGRYFGQNKEIVSALNGSVVYFNVGIGLTF
jgi:hypothetical protein